MKNISAFGLFKTSAQVEHAVATLKAAKFRETDMSVLLPENAGNKDMGHEMHSKAPEGAAAGGAMGALLGGVLGWLVGIGTLAIPGTGQFLAAGPMVMAMAGVGALGILGGLLGALIGAAIPEYEAKRYQGRVKHGGILLSVHCDDKDWMKRAKEILKSAGAEHISTGHEAPADYAQSDRPLPRTRQSIGSY